MVRNSFAAPTRCSAKPLWWHLLILLLPTAGLWAQPGGGGGIGFQHLYGRVGRLLVPLGWDVGTRVFALGKPVNGVYSTIEREDYAPPFKRFRRPVRLLLIGLLIAAGGQIYGKSKYYTLCA